MPNQRGTVRQGALEEAHPWPPERFARPEPQERRGAPGSRGLGVKGGSHGADPAGPRRSRAQERGARDWTGVDPQEPINPSMPWLKPGDQAG